MQAVHTRPEQMDLGLCLLTLLDFYSDPQHFNTQNHAIDVASDNGFAQKEHAQAGIDPIARQELADRLCAIDPISRHDIGSGSYRFAELLAHLRTLRIQLMDPTRMAHAPAPVADVEALRVLLSTIATYNLTCFSASCPFVPTPMSTTLSDERFAHHAAVRHAAMGSW